MNLARYRKDDILWLATHYCKHKHTYLQHPNCINTENPQNSPFYEKIGFFDIESGGSLTADWGFCLTYAIKERDGSVIKNQITPKEVRNKNIRDKRLIQDLCEDMKKFDKLVVYYGKDGGLKGNRHDIPFTRTRAVKWQLDYPDFKSLKIQDVYDIIRTKFKLARRRMEDACRLFNIECKATPLNPDVWQDALCGHKWAIDYIMQHNIEDVIALEKLWHRVNQYYPNQGWI